MYNSKVSKIGLYISKIVQFKNFENWNVHFKNCTFQNCTFQKLYISKIVQFKHFENWIVHFKNCAIQKFQKLDGTFHYYTIELQLDCIFHYHTFEMRFDCIFHYYTFEMHMNCIFHLYIFEIQLDCVFPYFITMGWGGAVNEYLDIRWGALLVALTSDKLPPPLSSWLTPHLST